MAVGAREFKARCLQVGLQSREEPFTGCETANEEDGLDFIQ